MAAGSNADYRLQHVIGINGNVGLCSLEREVAYATANRVVFHELESNTQRFIVTDRHVGCIATNHSRKLLAVAVQGSSDVEIFDSSTLRSTATLRHQTHDVQHISISDLSAVITITNAPESCTMTMFTMSKTAFEVAATLKLSSVMKSQVLCADISPTSQQISVLGREEMKMFRPTTKMNSRFIPLSLTIEGKYDYNVQCWLQSGDLIVGSANGKVLVITGNRDVKQVIGASSTEIQCITSCPRGFAIGCKDGSFVLFQRSDKNDAFVAQNSIVLSSNSAITSLGLLKKPSSDSISHIVLCLTETNELVKYPFEDCDEESVSTVVPSLNTKLSDMKELIPTFDSLHVDACCWLPLIAVGGYDGVLRIVNLDTKQIDVTHQFDDTITGVSLHPNGKYVLLSTTKLVCICSIHETKMNVVWHVALTDTSIVKFSPGGDRFGIAINSIVHVHDFNAHDYQNVSTFRAHSKPIVALEFDPYGEEACTVGSDSVVCLWDCARGKTLRRVNLLSPAILSGCVDWKERAAYVMAADGYLKKVNLDDGTIELDSKCELNNKLLTVLPSKQLIASSCGGDIKTIHVRGGVLATEYLANTGTVTSVAHNDGRLVIGDCGISIYRSNTKDSLVSQTYRPFDETIMRSRADLAAVDSKIKELEDKIGSLKSAHSSRLRLMKSNAENEKKMLKEVHQERLEQIRSETNQLMIAITAMKTGLDVQLDELKVEHNTNILSNDNKAQIRIAKETENTRAFENMCAVTRKAFQAEIAQIEEKHARDIQTETTRFHHQMTEVNRQCEEFVRAIDETRCDMKKREERIEEAAEVEIAEMWLAHHKEMRSLKRSNQLLSNEKSILQQRYHSQLDDLKELQDQISSQEESHQATLALIDSINKEIKSHTHSILEKDANITLRERDMSALSQANIEDEQRNADLTRQLSALEHDLKLHEDAVMYKETELCRLTTEVKHETNLLSHLKVELDGAKIKHHQAKKQIADLITVRSDKEKIIKSLEKKLLTGDGSALNYVNDHNSLKACLRTISEEIIHERQRRQSSVTEEEVLHSLEKKVKMMKQAMYQKKKTYDKELDRLKREYATLMKELENTKENDCFQVVSGNASSNVMKRQNEMIADLELKTLTGK